MSQLINLTTNTFPEEKVVANYVENKVHRLVGCLPEHFTIKKNY